MFMFDSSDKQWRNKLRKQPIDQLIEEGIIEEVNMSVVKKYVDKHTNIKEGKKLFG